MYYCTFLYAIQIISNLWLTCNLKYQWRNTPCRLEELHNISAWFAQPLVRSPYACYRPPPPTLLCSSVFKRMSRCFPGYRQPSRLKTNKLQLLSEGYKIIFSNYAFYPTLQQDRQCTYNVILRRVSVTIVAVEKQYDIF